MSSWVLILVLITDGYNSGGPALSSVGGFQSEAACMSAAKQWLKTAASMETVVSARAVCAKE